MRNFICIVLVFFSLSLFAQESGSQDSIVIGRSMVGIDLSPFTGLLIKSENARFSLQYKLISKKNDQNRLRASFSVFQESKLGFAGDKIGSFPLNPDTGYIRVNANGFYDQAHVGVGFERVNAKKSFKLIYGADAIIGRRIERSTLKTDYYKTGIDRDSVAFTNLLRSDEVYHTYESVVAGLVPFFGFEIDFTERLVFTTTLQAEASQSFLTRHKTAAGDIPTAGATNFNFEVLPARFFLLFKF